MFWQVLWVTLGCIYIILAVLVFICTCALDDFHYVPATHTRFETAIHYIWITICSIFWLPIMVFA
jgi:hypothetical protein